MRASSAAGSPGRRGGDGRRPQDDAAGGADRAGGLRQGGPGGGQVVDHHADPAAQPGAAAVGTGQVPVAVRRAQPDLRPADEPVLAAR